MKLLLDENLSPRHASVLVAAGHEAISAVEAGLAGAADSAVRTFAIREGRILVTLDGDFGNITRFSPAGTPGVAWLRPHVPTEGMIALLLSHMVNSLSAFDMAGRLAVVEADKIRIRAG